MTTLESARMAKLRDKHLKKVEKEVKSVAKKVEKFIKGKK